MRHFFCPVCWSWISTAMNKFMKILVFFDLPVTTAKNRREATRFRKFLLNDGYHNVY